MALVCLIRKILFILVNRERKLFLKAVKNYTDLRRYQFIETFIFVTRYADVCEKLHLCSGQLDWILDKFRHSTSPLMK